ncbi:MAG: carboxylating nicotinate-nucleotide diphosphorylase [Cellulomonas sp.]|jgi:nicotinate-nucleotide pyrophosphorylase (carboxylating)|nr:carboxylating nicotinate-nucleotide diphosphorylase [Cellulomonas sp.]
MVTVEPLPAAEVARLAALTLDEDLALGPDVTTTATVPPEARATARLVARAAGVVAGLDLAAAVFAARGVQEFAALVSDGDRVEAGQVLAQVTGPVTELLTAERSALNLLTHLSGIATATARWVDTVAGTGTAIRDTRKTTPGLRAAEKYAVRCGGGQNHRMGLGDEALIKDNHVAAAGGIVPAVRAVRDRFPDVFCEVECDTLEQVRQAVDERVALVLLDNMTPDQMRQAVAVCRAAGVRTEASGGLRLPDAAAVAATGVDYISVGALTHSAPQLDVALDL